jgi:hypothetical protein
MMLSDEFLISYGAYAVGSYESVPQFTREYRRLFGLALARDIKKAKAWLESGRLVGS